MYPTLLECAPEERGPLLQRAIDELARQGSGTLEVPAGIYWLRDSIHLRDSVHLRGEAGTIFTRGVAASSRIDAFLGYGLRELSVEEPNLFAVGDGVYLTNSDTYGFDTTVATIIARRGDTFLLDRPLSTDYKPEFGARASQLFPFISGVGVKDVSVSSLVLKGNVAETRDISGCRGGGAFFIGSQRVRLQKLEVRHYHGDAISFQQCADVIVENCELHHNTQSGLHPGSGSVRYVLRDNRVHDNGNCGLFYCLRTTHSICANNRFESNGSAGISVGEADSDHLICENTLASNGEAGILFRGAIKTGGDRVQIVNNVFEWNGQSVEKNGAEIQVECGTNDLYIAHNRFEPKHTVLKVAPLCSRIVFTENSVSNRAQSPEDIAGDSAAVSLQKSLVSFPVGPQHLELSGASHLGWPQLPQWSEDF